MTPLAVCVSHRLCLADIYDDLPDHVRLPPGVRFDGPRRIGVPQDGGVDLSFRWDGIDCARPFAPQITLELQLARLLQERAGATLDVEGGRAFQRAWEAACSQVR